MRQLKQSTNLKTKQKDFLKIHIQMRTWVATYRRHKNKLKSMVRQAKVDYLIEVFNIQSKIFTQNGCTDVVPHQFSDWQALPEEGWGDFLSIVGFNEFFQTVTVSDSHKAASKFSLEDINDDNAFEFNEISVDVVLSHLSSLDVTKSTGPDKLSAYFLREAAIVIAKPLQ